MSLKNTTLKDIKVVTESGQKYVNTQGIKALKDGVKSSKNYAQAPQLKKPEWLKVKLNSGKAFQKTKQLVNNHKLSTVCEEAKCPNISECWEAGTATIMIMGAICTRACKFCAVDTGNPKGWLDEAEPQNAAETVHLMSLKYVVITSVDRDDLADAGAKHYAQTIQQIKIKNPDTKIEALTPDFSGNTTAVDQLVNAGLHVFAQNIETVKRLTHEVRDIKAGYQQTLDLLHYCKRAHPKVLTKTSLMLGLGETTAEIKQCLMDLKRHQVDIVTLGQYLRPTRHHLPVERYVCPEEFDQLRQYGLSLGFLEVVAGPLVRSSYRADRVFEKNNLGLGSVHK